MSRALSETKRRAQARSLLLDWYDEHQRALPWRESRDPWAIWVSEVMLQQTRVASVLEYYPRFLARFPTPSALAEADWDEVAALWAGLGYYRRARNLHEAARQVCERHEGQVPSAPEAFAALKGVGPYTRGAVLSIAFGLEEPIVDGNVIRVLCRWYGEERDARSREVQKLLWSWAAEWARGERPGDLNQALMELGATRCSPRSPQCERCPISESCAARSLGAVERIPSLPKRERALPEERYLAALSRDEAGGVWVVQAGGEGLLAGLWGLPLSPWDGAIEPLERALKEQGEQLDLFTEMGGAAEVLAQAQAGLKEGRGLEQVGRLLAVVEHRFTHKRWRLYVFEAAGQPSLSETERGARCVSVEALSELALGGPSLKAGRAAGLALKARRGSGAR